MTKEIRSDVSDFGLSVPLDDASRKAILDEIVERGSRAARDIATQRGYSRVYTGGAPLAGLGSPRSDIDIFVVLDEMSSDLDEQVEYEGQRVDLEYMTLAGLTKRVAQAVPFVATATAPEQLGRASRSWLDKTTRFLLGEIVVDDGSLKDLHSRLTSGVDDFTKLVIARHAQDIQNKGEDVDGALLNGDMFSAEYQSREIVYHAAESVLCAEGDPYINTKWLGARWARTMRGKSLESLGELLENMGHPDRRFAVARNMWLSQDLVAQAATGYRYEIVTELPATTAHPRPFAWRDPKFALLPLADGLVATRDFGRGTKLSREGVLLWMVAHGRSRQQAVELAGEHFRAEGSAVSLVEIGKYYDSLLAKGLIMVDSVEIS